MEITRNPAIGISRCDKAGGFPMDMGVKRRGKITSILALLFVLAGGFTAWAWLRPYTWAMDEAARCKVAGVQVRKDHGYYWIEPHVKLTSGKEFDLEKPIRLISRLSGEEFEPAGTIFGTHPGGGPSEVWLKFWLEEKDLQGGLDLNINDGFLILKSSKGVPKLGSSGLKSFTSPKW